MLRPARLAGSQFRVCREVRNQGGQIGGHFSLNRVVEQLCLLCILFSPIVVGFFPTIVFGQQLLLVLDKVIAHFG